MIDRQYQTTKIYRFVNNIDNTKKMKKTIFVLMAFFTLNLYAGNKVKITVKNPTATLRSNEIVEIDFKKIKEKLKLKENETFVVKNASSQQIPYQLAAHKGGKNAVVIFQTTVNPNGKAFYTVEKGIPSKFQPKVYGRLVPERKDDFAWENDKIAFRVYGPALQATGEISSGIDVWVKSTTNLIVDKWYADDLSGKLSYHQDHGEGLDMYKVGPTLGAGASAPFVNGKLWYSKNFVSCEVLDNGPLRMTVKLKYAPYLVDQTEVKETRLISLDAGSQLNKISIDYDFNGDSIPVASGIVLRNSEIEKTYIAPDKCYFLHAEPEDVVNGTIYQAVIVKKPFKQIENKQEHLLGVKNASANKNYTYYTGAGWSKWGFATFEEWKAYVDAFSIKIKHPLEVKIK